MTSPPWFAFPSPSRNRLDDAGSITHLLGPLYISNRRSSHSALRPCLLQPSSSFNIGHCSLHFAACFAPIDTSHFIPLSASIPVLTQPFRSLPPSSLHPPLFTPFASSLSLGTRTLHRQDCLSTTSTQHRESCRQDLMDKNLSHLAALSDACAQNANLEVQLEVNGSFLLSQPRSSFSPITSPSKTSTTSTRRTT